MSHGTSITVIGGYGNAGRQIVRLLVEHTERPVVVAGRSVERAEQFVESLDSPRVSAAFADATDPLTLAPVLADTEVLVVAAGTSDSYSVTAEAALAAGCHQLDIQIGSAKNTGLRQLDGRAQAAGCAIITDCGFHPGVPAAMVRAVAQRSPGLTSAVVSSWIAVDWQGLGEFSGSTVDEMLAEFADYRYEAFVDGRWGRAAGMRTVVFPDPIGQQKVAAMGLDEMRELTAAMPSLRETGFYVGGFPTVVNYGVIPLVYAGMRLAPHGEHKHLGRLLDAGLRRFSKPPYLTVLQVDSGAGRPLMRLLHTDAYFLTAAPVVATVRQLVDGGIAPGVHLQAMCVDVDRFFEDLAQMGVGVED